MKRGMCVLALGAMLVASAQLNAQLPQEGDLIFGLSQFNAPDTLELVRGPSVANGGAVVPGTPWMDQNFIQSVEFDNFNGINKNANGNLLGVNFGASATGGGIYSFATTAAVSLPQQIADTGPAGIAGATEITRLSNLTVSPDNSKISVHGFDTGSLLVFDYSAGDTMGGGASASNARESGLFTTSTGASQGTEWLDNSTVLSLDTDGDLRRFDAANPSINSVVSSVTSPVGVGTSDFSSLVYEPSVSSLVFGMISSFDSAVSVTSNSLFVWDPDNNFSLVDSIDLSGSLQTGREMAFDADGNLFLAQFGGQIDFIPNAAATAGSLANDSSVDWYTSAISASFSGIDIALGSEGGGDVDGDFNDDGVYDCDDIDALMTDIAMGANTADFDLNGDTVVNLMDRDLWLAEAGEVNLGPGKVYLLGDADLSGAVDGGDFIVWNDNKFTQINGWCVGDFDGTGAVDGGDFIIWNDNKFMTSDGVNAVPEPASAMMVLLGLLAVSGLRRK